MNYYLDVWRKYAVFQGRARGKEYWFFVLGNFIIICLLEIIGMMMSGGNPNGNAASLLTGIYSLAVLLPSIGVTIRRLHDTDKTGWLILLALIPVLGGLIVLILCAMPGTVGPNKFGPDPTADVGLTAHA